MRPGVCPRGYVSYIFIGGVCPGGKCLGGKCPGYMSLRVCVCGVHVLLFLSCHRFVSGVYL